MAVVAIVIAEIAALGYLVSGANSASADGVIVRPGTAKIEIVQQTGDWGVLTVHRVVTPVAAWIVVQARQGNAGGVGAVMGYAHVPAGTSTDVGVSLDPRQGLVNTVVVSLLADAGQSGVFEYSPPALSGGGGGMMGGGSAPAQGDAASAPATPTIDKPLLAGGKIISVVVSETFRNGAPGTVTRVVMP